MSESFQRSSGRKVISRASAEELGAVDQLLVDAQRRVITAVIIGRGKKARLIDWAALVGFGPDAVMVGEEGTLREPSDDRERAGAEGKLALIGKRALTERGNELGRVDDLTFDPATGALEELQVGERHIPASALLGSGTYAAVLEASTEEGAG